MILQPDLSGLGLRPQEQDMVLIISHNIFHELDFFQTSERSMRGSGPMQHIWLSDARKKKFWTLDEVLHFLLLRIWNSIFEQCFLERSRFIIHLYGKLKTESFIEVVHCHLKIWILINFSYFNNPRETKFFFNTFF